jgi:hypothetical protein
VYVFLCGDCEGYQRAVTSAHSVEFDWCVWNGRCDFFCLLLELTMVRFGPSRVHQVPRRGRCPLCGYPSINLHHCYFKKSGNRNKTSLEWITETVEANTDGFKPRTHQVDALQALALRGDDAVLVFPTNAGKSLIYQIWPFLYVKGIVVVISPLIIIMEDQLMELNAQERFNYAKTTISNVRIVATHVTKETSANVLKNVNKGTLRVGESSISI